MTTLESFLMAILSDPQDEAARAVFADWLEVNGDGRAGKVKDFTVGKVQRNTLDLLSGGSNAEIGWAVGYSGVGRISAIYHTAKEAHRCLVYSHLSPLFPEVRAIEVVNGEFMGFIKEPPQEEFIGDDSVRRDCE